MFCQLEVLRHCFPSSIRRILDDLPESLDETYERILREIKKPNQEHAHRLLQCLVAAVRPLKVEELAEVLAFDFDAEGIPELKLDWRWENQEEAILAACSNLVIIVKDQESRVVQFSHFSVKEFLTAKRLVEPIRDVSCYHIRLDAAHTILVRACLGNLLRFERINRNVVKDFPLFFYAAQYWDTHARFENVSSRVKEGIRCLFDSDKPHFGAWLWVYQPIDGGISYNMWPEEPRVVPLYYAARLGFHDAAEHIIAEHPEQVNAKDTFDATPMHAAAEAGHADILPLLLEHGIEVDVRNVMNETPLHRASLEARLEAGKCLLDHGADINAQAHRKLTPLHNAARKGHVEFIRMLLERGAMINSRDFARGTPLHIATMLGKTQVVRVLLEYGADINARDLGNETPSEMASRFKQQEVLELLYKYGAEPVEQYLSVDPRM